MLNLTSMSGTHYQTWRGKWTFYIFLQPVVLMPMTEHTNAISGWKVLRNPITRLQNRMFCNRVLIERFQAGPCLLTGQGWHCWGGVLSPAFVRWWDRHVFLNETLRLLNREQISFTVRRFLYSIVQSFQIAIFRYVVTKFG